jgi:outer membrane protein OmpU
MKKQLLGTTTLVAAGLLMGQGAYAAEPMSLSIGGYLQSAFTYAGDDDGVGQPGAGLHENTISTDGEIQFTATTELDNGISVRARVEFEAFNAGNGTGLVDERYIRFSGGFGTFVIGQDDHAMIQMAYAAPAGSWQMGINSPTFGIPAVGGNAITSYTNVYVNTGGDGGKLVYFTPRISGFQLGVSYQPDGSNEPGGGFASTRTSDSDFLGQETLVSVGANYTGSFDEVDVAISAGYIHSELEHNGPNTAVAVTDVGMGPGTDLTGLQLLGSVVRTAAGAGKNQEVYTAGVNVSFSGFTIGSAYVNDNRGGNNAKDAFEIGATYATGPWTIGANYLFIEIEQPVGGDDEVDAWMFSGQYNLGPGVDLFGGVKYYDFEDAANAAGSENSVLIGALGTSIYF